MLIDKMIKPVSNDNELKNALNEAGDRLVVLGKCEIKFTI